MVRGTGNRLAAVLAMAGTVLAACSNDTATPESALAYPTAATLGEQSIRSVDDYLGEPPYSGADTERGARLASACRACHTIEAGGAHRIGPNLHGFFGRAAGAVEGFNYSPALKATDFTWTPRALEAWLAAPGKFLPGNRMTFAGVRGESDRADLIAYLLMETRSQ